MRRCLVLLSIALAEYCDLASTQNCLNGQFEEELGCRGKEGGETVGGRCGDGVNVKVLSEEQRC